MISKITNTDRVILHCDCNSFFASVETALNPEYKNVPMAVCGSVEDRHGIVLAKNEIAKKYKIETAETVYSAKRKCPSLVIVEPHHDEYVKFSRRVNDIYARFTEQIEPFGIDESWLDVTASQKIFGSGIEIAEAIRKQVREEIGITVSIGVSFNKVFAKLGSDYKKPDAITVLSRDNYKSVIYPLPASALIYVGKKTERALYTMGIKTIGELASVSKQMLVSRFGKAGEQLYKSANGLDDSPVVSLSLSDDAKSISNGFTFKHNLLGRDEWKIGVNYLCEDIGSKLRKNSQKCSTVAVTIKDSELAIIQRQRQLDKPTDISKEIATLAYEIILDEWEPHKPIRMITVSVSNMIKSESFSEQINMFDNSSYEKREKDSNLEDALDKIRQKYGSESIVHGSIIDTDIGIYDNKRKK